jgi:hypothetical protein
MGPLQKAIIAKWNNTAAITTAFTVPLTLQHLPRSFDKKPKFWCLFSVANPVMQAVKVGNTSIPQKKTLEQPVFELMLFTTHEDTALDDAKIVTDAFDDTVLSLTSGQNTSMRRIEGPLWEDIDPMHQNNEFDGYHAIRIVYQFAYYT